MEKLIRLDIMVLEEDVARLSGILALHASFGWEELNRPTGETCFRVYCDSPAVMENVMQRVREVLPAAICQCAEEENKDWLGAWKDFFTPVRCGRFIVLPPWLKDTPEAQGLTSVLIEPGSAFGTGHHATTALCLDVISDLLDTGNIRAGQKFLDLGTGSGVLGIGCCHSGLHGLGLDIEVLAVENARANCALNAVNTMEIALGSIDTVKGRCFDVVLANILSGPLKEMAGDIVAACAAGGCIVLSGLLDVQAPGVVQAYMNEGLPAPKEYCQGEWRALVWTGKGEDLTIGS